MQNNVFRVLALGDAVGLSGVNTVRQRLHRLITETGADFTVLNGENACEKNGLDLYSAETLIDAGADAITGGNHILNQREIFGRLDDDLRLLRPVNFQPTCPGRGYTVLESARGVRVLVINAMGQVFTSPPCDNPFVAVDYVLERCKGEYDLAICDFHAEATSEKTAFGLYFDGRINAIFGTHTHIPTADETVLPGGTGYITDVGMCGVRKGTVLGVSAKTIIKRFVTGIHEPFERGVGNSDEAELDGALFTFDLASKRCIAVERVKY